MNKSKTRKLRWPLLIFSLFFLAILCGCGDGPGESNDSSGGTTPTPTGSGSLTLNISSNTVMFGTPATATATLRDANGELIQGAVVSFAATNGLVTFTPTSATALTNASGIASVTLNAASMDSDGATSITASASLTSGGATSSITSTPVGIAVGGATVTLGTLGVDTSPISSYGTSGVRVPVLIDGLSATVPLSITFTSPCIASGKATITSPVTSVGGVAMTTYKDNGCASGTDPAVDTITASVIGGSRATANITINATAVSNVQFVSATPSIIATSKASTALLPPSSIVKFKVVDSNNIGKPGVVVDFTTVPPNPTSLFTLSALSATSDANGEVTTTLSSGKVPTPVWVVATVHGTSLKSQSNTLTITTGLPTQDFFSLSIQTPNIEGLIYDGVTSALTIIASDRLGNPVPEGTAINFITEGAQITPASCTTNAGTCTTTFKSSESRPTDGRVSILAYAIGEKSFVDANSNNDWDAGEIFYDIGDPYIDNDGDSHHGTGEFFITSSTSGTSACQPVNYGNALSKEGSCTASWGQNYARRNAVMVLSGSYAQIPPATLTMGSSCKKTLDLPLMDINGNPMPAGTTISTANNAVYYTPNGATTGSLATATITDGTPVLNTIYPTLISLTVNADCMAGQPAAYPAGTVDIVVTTPKGNKTTIPVTVLP